MLFYDWMLALTAPGAAEKSNAAALFRSRPLAFLADISMSLYLVHMPCMFIISAIFTKKPLPMPWFGIFLALPMSIIFGWLLTLFVERPLQRAIRQDKGQGMYKAGDGMVINASGN